MGGFTAATKLASGQYRFTVGGKHLYVLWNGVPPALAGTVVSYDMYGNASTNSASALSPTENAPLIVTTLAMNIEQ